MEKLNKIAKEWNALENDRERWEYLLKNKDKISLRLDDDGTYPDFCSSIIPINIVFCGDLPDLDNFVFGIGNAYGLKEMFDVLGIVAEGV